MKKLLWAIFGLAFGAIITPVIAPVLLRVSRPMAKTVAKTGLSLFRSGREKVARLRENLDDILAESRHELDQ